MEYIKDEDLIFLKSKYHDASKPFDSFNRFVRNDSYFDTATGMDGDAIRDGLMALDAAMADKPHIIRKAAAFRYVLENTRICCDKRDIYPCINCVDRPLTRTVIGKWSRDFYEKLLNKTDADIKARLESSGTAALWPDFDHSVPHWDRLFALGFTGIREEAITAREKLAAKGPFTKEQEDFFTAVDMTYAAIIAFVGRIKVQADSREGCEKMAAALGTLEKGAPQTFYEALMLIYVYFMLSEHIGNLQVRSLSAMDISLRPFYESDMARGVSEEQIRTEIAYFMYQFTAIGNYWNQPMMLGGTKADGTTETNALSYLILDVYDKLGIYSPKIQLKIDGNTPHEFIRKALDMIRHGHNSIVLVNGDTIYKAIKRIGGTDEQARTALIRGCYEYGIEGALGTSMNYLSLVKPLEWVLNGGCDAINGDKLGLDTPTEYDSFEAFFDAYKAQLRHLADTCRKIVNGYEKHLGYMNPEPMLSATFPSCLEKGTDVYDGGAEKNTSIMMFGFIANAADSIYAVKRLVFDEKRYTLDELRNILAANFEGYEELRREILHDFPHYGNNLDEPDAIAAEIARFAFECVDGKPNATIRGGRWVMGFHVARMSYIMGEITGATPDGRKRGAELSKNLSPSMGQSKRGATATVLSATKLDAVKYMADCAIDIGIHPSAAAGEDGLDAMEALVKTFLARGGHAMHINVFEAETLRKAKADPTLYPDLQIRVCGWNVLYNNIKPVEQDAFIRQAEALG